MALQEVDSIAVARDPKANAMRKALYLFLNRQTFSKLGNRLKNLKSISSIPTALSRKWRLNIEEIKPKIVNVEHHMLIWQALAWYLNFKMQPY